MISEGIYIIYNINKTSNNLHSVKQVVIFIEIMIKGLYHMFIDFKSIIVYLNDDNF